jgi:hypothetical protein
VRGNKKPPLKSDKTQTIRGHKRGVVGYSRKTALLEEAITQMNAGKYGRSSTALKELLALDPQNMEARRLFATLHLRLGSLIPARQAFDELISEAFQRQDYWLAESLLREYLAAGPRCVPFLEKLGALYQAKGDGLEAVAEYGKAIDILIEDPDPDNPDHASQLYAKIRELAPASPVAFRLASLFDTQTGELLARPSGDSGQPTVVPAPDRPEGRQGVSESPEPTAGVMPWEIQDSQAAVQDSLKVADVVDSPRSLIPPTITDPPAHQGSTLDGEAVPSDPPLRIYEQPTSDTSEMRGDAPEETRIHEFGSTPSGAQMDDRSGQVVLGGCHPLAPPSEPAAESPETQPGPDSAVSTADPVAVQEQERLLAEAEPEASHDVSGSSTVSAPTESVTVPDSPISSAQSIEDAGSMPSSKIEEISLPASLGTEPSIAEPIEAEERQPALLQPVESDSTEIETEQPSGTPPPASPEPIPANEMSEPWKQPGFSWESLFNRAWKFGSDHAATVLPLESTRPNVEEAPPPASAASPLLEPVLECRVVEIPEREEAASLGDQTSSGSPIAPMPWDQVQESVISIPPAQVDPPPMEESLKLAVDQSVDPAEPGLTIKVSESQTQPPSSPDLSVTETESFSIVQTPQTPASPESEISAADLGHISSQTEGAPVSAEPEQQVPVASAPRMDEPPLSEAPLATVVSPVFEDESITDNVIVPSEVPPKSADPVLSADDDRAIEAAQNPVQESMAESPVAPSQPPREAVSGATGEIPLPTPPLKQRRIWEPPSDIAETPPPARETAEVQVPERHSREETFIGSQTPIPKPVPEPEEWVKAGEAIRFIELPQAAPVAQVPPEISQHRDISQSMSVAAAAVDVLFESSRNVRRTDRSERTAETEPNRKLRSTLARIRIAISSFVRSCFSTTRAIVATCVGLVVLSGVLVALGIGAIALTWVVMEEPPSSTFQSLTTVPQRTLSDYKKNGYLLLLGFDGPAEQDPIQAGYERKSEIGGADKGLACIGGFGGETAGRSTASSNVLSGWFRSADPVGQFRSHQDTIKEWSNQHHPALNRYGQWHKLSFEDWGYGQPVTPPCASIVFAHQLHVAGGFVQGADIGVDRLETDMEAWRIVLSQAKTLSVKTLALQAINDDIAVASGLLVRSDFDGKYLPRVTKFLRPLDQAELSLRWPMQSELVSASKTYEAQLKAERTEEQTVHAMVASALPLPKQRRLNDYAEYYEASYRAAGEGQHGSLPKWKHYIQFPASSVTDYFTNPIENIVGLEPLAPWDLYNGFVVDTDAHLRLASLQAWLRRGPADGDLLTRTAKAGQRLYDPYTGLPMLVNMKKGVLYSVGHDGKDQDADPQSDVVVEIPIVQASTAPAKPSAAPSKSR